MAWASQVVLVVKNLPANAGDTRDLGLIPGWGRSPEEDNGYPLQYSCLENPHGLRSLASCSSQGRTELDTAEATKQQQRFKRNTNNMATPRGKQPRWRV